MKYLMKPSVLIPAAAILAWGVGFAGSATGDQALTLDDLIKRALGSNPGLLVLREEAESARFRPSSASTYPFPRLTYTHFLESVETRLGPQRDILQLMQPVPFPGKLSLKSEIASFDIDISGEKIKQAELAVIRRVKETYYTLAENLEVLGLLEKESKILDNIREITRVRLESGRGYQHHLLGIEVELLRIKEKKLEYEKKRNSAVSVLKGLLDMPAEESLEVITSKEALPVAAVPDSLFASAASNPGVLLMERLAEKERKKLDLARKGYLPDFTLGAGYIRIDESSMDVPDSGRDSWNISVGMSLPLWFGSVRSEVAESRSMVRVMELRYRAERRDLVERIDLLRNRYRAAAEIAGLYRSELIPRAGQALQSAREGYLSGKIDYIEILDAQRQLISLKIKYAERKAEAFIYLAGLEEATGSRLIE
ncbi:MAG: hypothetical protein GF417_08650 [Candidatus Latescibacteria bacterium]|nr:hypothetical protein [bacterium]MBD3424491.1 hypothetical protein [Candidatus Latescibacterota bacterium]